MMKWLTYEQVEEFYGMNGTACRQMVQRGVLRTKLENCIQYFHVDDLVQVLSTGIEHLLEADGWACYSDLYQIHGIKRGWLDSLVKYHVVRYEMQNGVQVFSIADVLKELKKDPSQKPKRFFLRRSSR